MEVFTSETLYRVDLPVFYWILIRTHQSRSVLGRLVVVHGGELDPRILREEG